MNPTQLRLVPYQPRHREAWNRFVHASKNGTFLFDRGYIEYHEERFVDASLLAFEGEDERTLVAVLPACLEQRADGDWLVSHAGLTYGGWVSHRRMTTRSMVRLIALLRIWCAEKGIVNIRYKVVPRCYHVLPSEEDIYALFVHGAQLVGQDVTSVIDLAASPRWSSGRRHGLAKARGHGVTVEASRDFADFHDCLTETLARHHASPVHSVDELVGLAQTFASQIRLFAALRGGVAIAYVLMFDCGQTVHTQYMAAREDGRRFGGLDAIIAHLQRQVFADRRYFSFGRSTQELGLRLNQGLIAQKEMFGAQAMVCSFYDLATAGADAPLPDGAVQPREA